LPVCPQPGCGSACHNKTVYGKSTLTVLTLLPEAYHFCKRSFEKSYLLYAKKTELVTDLKLVFRFAGF